MISLAYWSLSSCRRKTYNKNTILFLIFLFINQYHVIHVTNTKNIQEVKERTKIETFKYHIIFLFHNYHQHHVFNSIIVCDIKNEK